MSLVTVRFLGSGDAVGSGGRFQACLWIESATERLLLDCGTSSLIAIKKSGLSPSAIDAIFVTHLHGDHFGGIPFFLLDAQFSKRERPLTIAGPPGLWARTRDAMEVLFPGSSASPRRVPLKLIELDAKAPIRVGSVRATAYPVEHDCGAPPYALRIECAGRTIVYSGDTEWTDTLLEAASGADLFVCEAYFFERRVKFHLDYKTLALHRAALGCKRLIVTHMSDDMLSRVERLATEGAFDGMVVEL